MHDCRFLIFTEFGHIVNRIKCIEKFLTWKHSPFVWIIFSENPLHTCVNWSIPLNQKISESAQCYFEVLLFLYIILTSLLRWILLPNNDATSLYSMKKFALVSNIFSISIVYPTSNPNLKRLYRTSLACTDSEDPDFWIIENQFYGLMLSAFILNANNESTSRSFFTFRCNLPL